MLKILAFTDMHGSMSAFKKIKKLVKECDIIVCAGDISIFERDLRKILKNFNDFRKPMILIPGNHESESALEKAARKLDYIMNIQDSFFSTGNYHFMCAEGNGFAYEDPRFKMVGKNFLKKIHVLRKIQHDLRFVLVTHAPPHNTRLDKVMGGHCGNKSIRRFIAKAKPDLAICGHIHENAGKKDRIGKTRIINPGPYGMIVTLN